MAATLAYWIEKFIEHMRYQNASPHTLRNYASDLQQFFSYLTRTPEGGQREAPELEQIDNLTIREFLGRFIRRTTRNPRSQENWRPCARS